MRLLNTETYKLQDFEPEEQEYAILSHTWGPDEVSYQELVGKTYKDTSGGWLKIKNACLKANSDGFAFIWIDTCCIDKTNLVELTEAINSMFRWYEASQVCYAYLEKLPVPNQFDAMSRTAAYQDKLWFQTKLVSNRWFKRGWTLQELLAPRHVIFLADDWSEIGTKTSLAMLISQATSITREHMENFHLCNFATKMTWMEQRETKKAEDRAYCLLGLFDVSMPLLYGEGGAKAFARLQQEIIRAHEDDSFLAWEVEACHRVLALSPDGFKASTSQKHDVNRPSLTLTSKGLDISPIMYQKIGAAWFLMPLNCSLPDDPTSQIAMWIERAENTKNIYYRRRIEWNFPRFPNSQLYKRCDRERIYIQDEISESRKSTNTYCLTLNTILDGKIGLLDCIGRKVTQTTDKDTPSRTFTIVAEESFDPEYSPGVDIYIQPNATSTLLEMQVSFVSRTLRLGLLVTRSRTNSYIELELLSTPICWTGSQGILPTPSSPPSDYVKTRVLNEQVEVIAHVKPRGTRLGLRLDTEPLFENARIFPIRGSLYYCTLSLRFRRT